MIKFRNPVSDINIIIGVFKKLYMEFSDVEYFDLDNIAEFLAREKLASSSGYTGNEALKRSYQVPDDSRKSLKMQAKSYSEVYRFLGWIYSTNEKALNFTFTYLGLHVALSGNSSKNIFEQCLLGITYPNMNLSVKFKDINKPFITILWFANKLDNLICRDEIIISAMNISDATNIILKNEKLNIIKNLRESQDYNRLQATLENLSNENNMQVNSIKNLTRFVMSSLIYVGWFEKCKINMYGKENKDFLKLTNKGKLLIDHISNSLDVYGCNINELSLDISSLASLGFLNMLENSGFDVAEDKAEYKNFQNTLKERYGVDQVLFSPFQFYSKTRLSEIAPHLIIDQGSSNHNKFSLNNELNSEHKVTKDTYSLSNKITRNEISVDSFTDYIKNIDINKFLLRCKLMKQNEFYPLIAKLLSIIFDRNAYTPPVGNNNLRFDVIIPDNINSIPVEVKSPTEEEMLSVKAIRQALENKLILLSRKPHNTSYTMTSLAVGFKIPNNRSDVYKLIDDIHNAYGVNISILDLKTIIVTAKFCTNNNMSYNIEELNNVKGVINFKYENI